MADREELEERRRGTSGTGEMKATKPRQAEEKVQGTSLVTGDGCSSQNTTAKPVIGVRRNDASSDLEVPANRRNLWMWTMLVLPYTNNKKKSKKCKVALKESYSVSQNSFLFSK